MPHGEVVALGISGVFSEQLPDGLLVAKDDFVHNLPQGVKDRLLGVALPVEQDALAGREA